MRRFRAELRATAHVAHALTWLRGPKCVASSSSLDRIRVSLESTDLIRFFDPYLFSASDVRNGKPAPDLFLHAAGKMRVRAGRLHRGRGFAGRRRGGVAAGMTAIGFVGGSHASVAARPHNLRAAGARAVIADMRALKSTVIELRGW